jgi:hypothetical protein
MAENLTADPKAPEVPTRKFDLRKSVYETRYILLGTLGLIAVCATILVVFSERSALVTLRETDFACSQPAATNRYRFDKVETCNQYTRKVPVWIK